MDKEQQNQPLVLKLSRELWEALTPKQQAEQRAKFYVAVKPNYAPAPDLDTPIELVMVPRHA